MNLRATALSIATEIGEEVSVSAIADRSIYRLTSAALVTGYLGMLDESQAWVEKTEEILDALSLLVHDNLTHTALFGGLAGIGWVMEHLSRLLDESDDEQDAEDPLDDLDDFFIFQLAAQEWTARYDLIAGLAGLAVYFLERLPRRVAALGLTIVLSKLEQIAVRTSDGGLGWFTPPDYLDPVQRADCPQGHYNLGMAHGAPAVLCVASEALRRGICTAVASRLIAGVRIFLEAPRGEEHFISALPPWIAPGRVPLRTRFGWCYGSIGVAAALHHVACAQSDPATVASTQNILRAAVGRFPEDVRDAGLCHGAFGIAHLFNRVYQRSGDITFKGAAIAWYERGIQMRCPGTGVAGYYTWRPELREPRDPDSTFLAGASGVALALISSAAPVAPHWDRLLLLSGHAD